MESPSVDAFVPDAGSEIVADTNAGEDAVYAALTTTVPEGVLLTRRRLDVGDFLIKGGGSTMIAMKMDVLL